MGFQHKLHKYVPSVAGKFAITVSLISLFVGLLAAVSIAYIEINDEEKDRVRMIERMHLSSEETLLDSLWMMNVEVVETVLTGISNLPGVEEVTVITESGDVIKKGKTLSQKIIKHEHPLLYSFQGKEVSLGTVSITVGLDNLFNQIYHSTKHLFLIIALLALGAGWLTVVLFNRLVAQHLKSIAEHSANLNLDNLDVELSLQHRKVKMPPDELEQIVMAFNMMCQSLKQSLQKIKSKESMFEDIVTNSSDMIFRLDLKGSIIYANPAAEKQVDDTLKAAFKKIVLLENYSDLYTKKKTITLTAQTQKTKDHLNGRSYALCLSPELSAKGDLKTIIGIAHDITVQNKEVEFLRAIFAHAPVLMTVSDIVTGCCYDLNEKFIESTGYTREKAVGSTSVELGFLRTEDRRRISQILKNEGIVENIELNTTKVDGKEMICRYSGQIINVEGELKLLSIAHDITLEKQMAKEQDTLRGQLIQATKMEAIGTLAGGIAHDFNNILSAIIGYGQLVLDDLEDFGNKSTTCEDMRQVIIAARRAADLVQQILTFSRQSVNDFRPYVLQKIIKEVVKLLRSTIPVTIELYTDIESDENLANIDPGQIHQLLMNILTNSRQAIGLKHGKISITLNEEFIGKGLVSIDGVQLQPGSYHRLTIEDDGVGMRPEVLARLFEPFFTTKEKGEGTGMGMAVCHGIVSKHKGTLSCESELGQGTTFNIYLPVCSALEIPQIDNFKETDLDGTETIMLVDDEKPILKMLEKSLSRCGYRTVCFTNAQEALNYFRDDSKAIDILVTDMTMPVITGVELSRKILGIRPHFPIIICTGHSDSVSEEVVLQVGVQALMQKPVTKKQLLSTVRNLLDK